MCPTEINVSGELNIHIHACTHVDTHTHKQLKHLSFFLSTCISTFFLCTGNSQPNEAVLTSPNESENTRLAFLASLAVGTKAQDLSKHHQSDEPAQELQRSPRAPSGKRDATGNIESHAGLQSHAVVTGVSARSALQADSGSVPGFMSTA